MDAGTTDRFARSDYEVGFDHAWAWFTMHSQQRMLLLNVWFVVLGVSLGAVVSAVSAGQTHLALGISVGGAALTVTFNRLEGRSRQLIDAAERVLENYQDDLAATTGIPGLALFAAVKTDGRYRSYGSVMRATQVAAAVAYLGIGIAAATSLL